MPANRSRRGCDTCRKRHIKCDEQLPVCQRCEESRRECSTRPFISMWRHDEAFRPEDNEANDHHYLRIPKTLVFVPEDLDGPASQAEPQGETEAFSDRNQDVVTGLHEGLQTSPDEGLDSAMTDTNLPATPEYPLTLPNLDTSNPGLYEPTVRSSLSFPSDGISPLQEVPPEPDLSPLNDRDGHSATTLSPTDLPFSTGRCPLSNRTEALLLRHFVKELSPWFDVTDPTGHFRVVVPELALVSEVVLNAIFAISALHLGCVPDEDTVEEYGVPVDAVLAEVYHTRCIGMLIALIDEETSNTNDDVLTAAVILRKFEEMRGYVTQQDYGSHLQGVSALFNSRSCAIAGGLAEAAFWQFVRQDAFLSLSIHQAPKIDFSKQAFKFSVTEAPDYVWANRIIFCAAIILTYCFSNQPKSHATWQDLDQQVNEWDATKPASFTPIFFDVQPISEGTGWPEMQFYAPWHATGTQYFHLCKVLLNLYRPDTPFPGAGLEYNRAHREMKEAIMHHTRLICSIAQSNYFVNPRFNIGPIILMCGGWVTEVDEQRRILHLLHETEKAHGWPTKHVRNLLEEHWGMNPS